MTYFKPRNKFMFTRHSIWPRRSVSEIFGAFGTAWSGCFYTFIVRIMRSLARRPLLIRSFRRISRKMLLPLVNSCITKLKTVDKNYTCLLALVNYR